MSNWKKTGERKARGKKTGAVVTNTRTGQVRVLLNPHGKYQKYTDKLKNNKRYTNDGKVKSDKNGKPQRLSKSQQAYRAGYRSAIIDQTAAYKTEVKDEFQATRAKWQGEMGGSHGGYTRAGRAHNGTYDQLVQRF